MEKQVTSCNNWLLVFTLLTTCRLGSAVYVDLPLYSHKSQTQSVNLQFIINVKFYLTLLNFELMDQSYLVIVCNNLNMIIFSPTFAHVR